MTGIPSYSNTGNTGSSSSASSALGIYCDLANASEVYSDMASYTNALERVQQKIGNKAALLRHKNTDMPYKSKQLELLGWCATLPKPELARPHTPPTICAYD